MYVRTSRPLYYNVNTLLKHIKVIQRSIITCISLINLFNVVVGLNVRRFPAYSVSWDMKGCIAKEILTEN
jgi:hypothetical protein